MPFSFRRWRSPPRESPPSLAAPEGDLRGAFLARPEDRKAFDRWVAALRKSGRSEDEVCDALADAQDDDLQPIPLILLHLLTRETLEEPWRHRFATHLATFAAGRPAQECRQVWSEYSRLRPLDSVVAERVRRLGPHLIQLSFLTADPGYRRVGGVTDSAWSGDRVLPAELPWSEALPDVDRNWFHRVAQEFLAPEEPAADRAARREFVLDSVADLVVNRFERFISFQDRLVRTGGLGFPDPLDPESGPLQPFDSFMVFDRTVYAYAGRELFLLVAGGAGSRVLGVQLAARNVLVDFEAGLKRPVSAPGMANLLSQVLRRVTRLRDAYAQALVHLPSLTETRSVVVAMGRAENFAHHLWNYYPGFERLVEGGLADRVSELHSAGTEFFGPVQDIFPEFVDAKLVRNPRGGLWDPHPFSADHLVVQPGGYFVNRALLERVVRKMASLPVVDYTAHQPVFQERPFPIVWIGLRVGSRSWWDQENQVPELVRRLLDRYPGALFLLDGFSYPLGQDEVSAKWSQSIERLRELAASIVAASPDQARVLNLVGNTLRESVLWAREVDTYLTAIGTSQHKVGWLTDAPGAVFGPPEHRPKEGSPQRVGAWAAEGVTLPAFVVGEPVAAGERRNAKDVRSGLQNLRLDLDQLVETLTGLIEQRRAQSGRS